MGWLSGYGYRKTVAITGQTGAGSNYQVPLSIAETAGGDFHLEGHALSFPNDLRFTDNDQITQLDYWIEDLTLDPITAWIEVLDSLESNVSICCYYGKSGDTTTSDGDATFLFFDDFEDGSIADWTTTAGSPGIESATPLDGLYSMKFPTANSNDYSISPSFGSELTSFALDCNFKINQYYHDFRFSPSGGWVGNFWVVSPDVGNAWVKILSYDGSWHDVNVVAWTGVLGTKYKLSVRKAGAIVSTYINDAVKNNAVDLGSYNYNAGKTCAGSYGRSVIDNIRIRKYVSPEPAFASAGAEESAPTEYVPRSGFSFFTPGVL